MELQSGLAASPQLCLGSACKLTQAGSEEPGMHWCICGGAAKRLAHDALTCPRPAVLQHREPHCGRAGGDADCHQQAAQRDEPGHACPGLC